MTQASCEAKGCIFDDVVGLDGVPLCYLPPDYGYKVVNDLVTDTGRGFFAELYRANPSVSLFGGDFDNAYVSVEYETNTRLRIKIAPNASRWEVPMNLEPDPTTPSQTTYRVSITTQPFFGFQVVRVATGAVIFDSSGAFANGLTIADQFLQVAAALPSGSSIYGLGEHEQHSYRHDTTQWKTFGILNYAKKKEKTSRQNINYAPW